MDYWEFARLRNGLIINLSPPDGTLIDSAASKLRQRLASSAMFSGVEVETTEDPDQLLVGLVRYRPGTPEGQVSSFLEAVWVSELRLPGLDAFHFLTDDGHVELWAVTGDQAFGHFLSLHLIASEGSAQDFQARPPAETDIPEPDMPEPDIPATRKGWFRR